MSCNYYYRQPPGLRESTVEYDGTVKKARALEIWRAGSPIAKTPGDAYLRSRGIRPDVSLYPDSGDGWPETLRWSGDLTRSPKPPTRTALVATINDAHSGLVVAIHRIIFGPSGFPLLHDDGKKQELSLGLILGNAFRGSCWQDPQGRWGIAEGVETALAATQLMRFPVWASISAGNMARIQPPIWARYATIFAGNDENGVGFDAALMTLYNLRKVLGSKVRILMADKVGTDVNDVLQEAPYG